MTATKAGHDVCAGDDRADLSALHASLPPLEHDHSFWGMAVTQFFGAFNDNLFKQLMLLLATPTAAQLAAETASDRQGEAQVVFAAAFLMFSGVAGFVADRFSKRVVIILSKVGEILVMLLGMIGFMYYGQIGFGGMLVVLYLMGVQSALFGPAKYGILPEMLRPRDLPRANGIFLMLTFLAIIFGTAAAGVLLDTFRLHVWIGSLVCVAIAVVGTATSFLVRRVPVAQPDLKHRLSSWAVPAEVRQLLRDDRELLRAILVVSVFWMVGAMTQPAINALGKSQLGLSDGSTSVLAASIGFGIAVGCALGGVLSRGRVNRNVVTTGAVGVVATMFAMCIPGGERGHLLGFYGSIPVLVVMGVFTGMFIVPIQVALQSRPPREEKGRMIATMNQISWVGIIIGAIFYQLCIWLLDATGWPRNLIFGATASLMLPLALFYRPQDETLAEA